MDLLLTRIARGLDVQWASWETVARVGLEELGSHLAAGSARIFLADPGKDLLQLVGRWEAGSQVTLRTSRDPAGASRSHALAGRAWLERRVLWDPERESDPARGGARSRHHGVAIPLLGGGTVAGVIELELNAARDVTAHDVPELEVAGRMLGEALARVRVAENLAEVAGRSFVLVLSRSQDALEQPADSFRDAQRPAEATFAIAHASPAFCRMTGFTEADLKGRSLRAIMGPKTDRDVIESLRAAFQRGERISTEFTAYRKNGTHFPLHFDMSPVLEPSGQVTHFVLMPPESLATGASTSVRQADTDALTGLANRTFLHETLRRAIERSLKNPQVRFALLFIDLDGFKRVNDTLGHVIGDELLVMVARELEGAVRPGDVVARFGGDEFVILIELLSGTEDAIAVAERIQDRLGVPLRISGRAARVSGSIGVALSDTGYTAVEDVLRDADAAMYLAKEKGGGGYRIFDTHLQEAASTTQRIRAELQRSLEQGDFRLHYQPVVDLASGRTTGFEALLRWHQAERGIVPATEFIRQAEKTGLILPIGRWVIHEACRQARAWRDALPSDRGFTLSVNLSERELLDPSLLEAVKQAIADTGAEASWLRFEIPESLLARPHGESRAVLQPLIDLDFRFGVGDFGRGQSSLASLIRYPLDQLKIDRQFMVDLHDSETSRRPEETRALRSILALAGELEIEVAAAGIETSSQRRVLQRLACRYGQGHLFSVPVDGSTAVALLRKT